MYCTGQAFFKYFEQTHAGFVEAETSGIKQCDNNSII